MTSPLQILLFRHADDADFARYEDAIIRAIQGGKDAGGYLASGEDLGIQTEVFRAKPQVAGSAAEVVERFSHTLVVVLADHALLDRDGEDLWDWLADCWRHIDASGGRHAILPVVMDERIGEKISGKRPGLETLQFLPVAKLGEREIRPAVLALQLLHRCRLLLAGPLPTLPGFPAGYLRIFISHAKIDGLPLAQALKKQIESLNLQKFYDADDLPPGCNWQRELERGVHSSIVVMLRTEVYDSRPWCRQEVHWADEYATPAVLVDARTGLNFAGSTLPYERVPVVRIPDGNLMRILFIALREGLRFVHFLSRVELLKQQHALLQSAELKVFSLPPSMPALLKACQTLAASPQPPTVKRIILYPDPPLGTGLYEAANALVSAYVPDALLVTPNSLAAIGAAAP
jgi:hypothetical protein